MNYGEVLSIDNIGESHNNMALVCKTTKRPCCFTKENRYGEWLYPNGNEVPTIGGNQSFYRSRSDSGEVLLNQRTDITTPRMSGLYCCVIPDDDTNCGITQRFCITLGKFVQKYEEMKHILAVFNNVASLTTIIQPERNANVGEDFYFKCVAAVGSGATSIPIITWSGPNGATMETNSPKGVVLENSSTSDSFTSTLKFIPLQALHEGNYTCQVQFQQNNRSSSIYLDVTGIVFL